METHPDKNQEKKTAAADFQAVKNAWDRIRPFIEAQEKKT
jgi:DnaJ-class molecular chaperone